MQNEYFHINNDSQSFAGYNSEQISTKYLSVGIQHAWNDLAKEYI